MQCGAIGNKFQKLIYHSILCVGAVIARREGDHWAIDSIDAPHVGERSEKELITAFVEKIAELKPQLITFNGTNFDLPVLRYRSMIHQVSAPGMSMRPYFKRFTNDSLDLCDELSSFQSNGKAILSIGVLVFECFLRTLTSLVVHSRRTTFFTSLVFRTLMRSLIRGGAVSIALAFEQLTNQRDRQMLSVKLETSELASYAEELSARRTQGYEA